MNFEVMIDHDDGLCVVDAEGWDFGPNGTLIFYDTDGNVVEVFRDWAHMTVSRAQETTGHFPPNVKGTTEEVRGSLDELDRRDPAGIYKKPQWDWNDPEVDLLRMEWLNTVDRLHRADVTALQVNELKKKADDLFQKIKDMTGIEGLEYELASSKTRLTETEKLAWNESPITPKWNESLGIPQTAPGKPYQPEASADIRTETVDRLMEFLPMGGFSPSVFRAWREWLYGRGYVAMPKMEKARLRSFVNAMRDFIHDQARAMADLSDEVEQANDDYRAACKRVEALEQTCDQLRAVNDDLYAEKHADEMRREVDRDIVNEVVKAAQDEGVTHDATGGNADTDLFQPGWSKVTLHGGPIHGHEGLMPRQINTVVLDAGDGSTKYTYGRGAVDGVLVYEGLSIPIPKSTEPKAEDGGVLCIGGPCHGERKLVPHDAVEVNLAEGGFFHHYKRESLQTGSGRVAVLRYAHLSDDDFKVLAGEFYNLAVVDREVGGGL